MRATILLLLAMFSVACVGWVSGGDASRVDGGAGGSGGSIGGGAGRDAGSGACLAGTFLAELGRDRLLVGASMTNAVADRAPFTLRYQYLAGGLFPGAAPCASCQTGCNEDWWGCWQDLAQPPGAYVRSFIAGAKARHQVPMLTYYEVLPVAGWDEGAAEVAALNDVASARQVFNDWRFLLQQIGQDTALLHVEPDLWGYAQQGQADPHAIPAQVRAANPDDCAQEEDSLAGVGRCLVKMVRSYAPHAKVGLHASAWATNVDVTHSSDQSLDVAGEAAKVGLFLKACAPDADFIVVEASDRDAGWYQTMRGRNTWWDATNATLPNFHRAFAWARAVAEAAGKPVLWWQLPVGNLGLDDTPQHYQDNRVAYFFAHPDEVAAAHGAGFAFGAGEGQQTNPATDGDFLVGRVQAYAAVGGQAPCPGH